MSAQGLCRALADYAAEATLDALDAATLSHLGDAFTNWMACAVGGARHPTVEAAAGGLTALADGGAYTPIGRAEAVGLVDVAVLDCLSSAVLAYDDVHFETALHPTGPVAAALLAWARRHGLDGATYLTALHVGMEVQCRVALAYTAPRAGGKLGWYATGIAGGIGVAAAIGRVMGLDAAGIANAMAMAAARACGNRGTHGSMTAAYVPSTAAESGLIAAFLTQAGMTCGNRALDGTNGLLELLADQPDSAGALVGLGAVSIAAQTAFKPYPSGFVTHAAIDACLYLRAGDGLDVSRIESLELRVSPSAYGLGSNPSPGDAVEAQVSIQHWAALTLLQGAAGIIQAQERWLNDAATVALRARIAVVPDPQLSSSQCIAQACGAGGALVRVDIEHATGSPGRPMTRGCVERKAAALFASALPPARATRMQTHCEKLRSLSDVASILLI